MPQKLDYERVLALAWRLTTASLLLSYAVGILQKGDLSTKGAL